MCRTLQLSWIVLLGTSVAQAGPKTVAVLEEHLQQGKLAAAQQAMEAELKQNPKDPQAKFGLGTIQVLRTIEKLSQDLYRHGTLQHHAPLLAFTGAEFPLPLNSEPQEINYKQARQILQNFVTGLGTAEATLAGVGDAQVNLPLHFGLIRMDLDGNGSAGEDETLWILFAKINGQTDINEDVAKNFVINFDTGDVYWLRGYCHFLMGLSEPTLAHDYQQLFERAGHLLFPKTESPYPFLKSENTNPEHPFQVQRIIDLVAYIHLLNLRVAEPERMAAALKHFEAMADLSSKSWDAIEKETDDEHEWIPNPKQSSVIPDARVTAEMITAWRSALAELKLLLQGKKLIPFWRNDKRGINLRLVFTEPKQFDLVLWIQGTAAAPYLQEGEMIDVEVFRRMRGAFGARFIGFAIWFN